MEKQNMNNNEDKQIISLFDISIQLRLVIAKFYELGYKTALNKYLERQKYVDESHYIDVPEFLVEFSTALDKCRNMILQYLYERNYIREISESAGTDAAEKNKTIQIIKTSRKKVAAVVRKIKTDAEPSVVDEAEKVYSAFGELVYIYLYIVRYRRCDIERVELLRKKILDS